MATACQGTCVSLGFNSYICCNMAWSLKNMTRAGLQVRMTAYVTGAVLFVSAVVLLVIASSIRNDYEEFLDERLSDDLAAITRNIEQRMLRVEEATALMSGVSSLLSEGDFALDSLLGHTLAAIVDARSVAIVLREGYVPGCEGFYTRYAKFDDSDSLAFGAYIQDPGFGNFRCWKAACGEGKSVWSEPSGELYGGLGVICYTAPLCRTDGERVGAVFLSVPLSRITSFVTAYKVRKDIDVSIYSAEGTMLVAPDAYILELAAGDLITRESSIEHLGWKVVLSADRKIIDREVRIALLSLSGLILLMFLVMSLVIRFTVRFVAKPFIEQQQRTEREKAVMDGEMKLAAGAQNDLVPHTFPPFPSHPGIDISACLYPARSVGGDLYDYFIDGNRLYFCIGDVSGKGVQASLFMAATHYLFRSVAAGMPPDEAVGQMNRSLCTDNEQCRFVTFWFGSLDLAEGTLDFVNAGHDAPVLVRDGVTSRFQSAGNLPLGILAGAEFKSDRTVLVPGDILLLYTDGVTEAMDTCGHELGREKPFEALDSASGADSMINCVLERVRQHASGAEQSDDITMLCLKFIAKETKN